MNNVVLQNFLFDIFGLDLIINAYWDEHGCGPNGEDANWVRVKRELESGWFQWVGMPTPALLTIQSGINQLRYATLKGIMAAKKKKIEKIDSPRRTAHQKISKLYVPEKAKKTNLIECSATEAAGELVRLLREDAVML